MAHQASDGSMWTNARQAKQRSMAVPGKAQGDGKQPVKSFSKPEAPRAATATDTRPTSDHSATDAPQVDVQQDGDMFVVTAKYSSADEAHAAAQQLQGTPDSDQDAMQPPAGMM